MQKFKVEGMSCAHCERAVTEAIHLIDPAAEVQVDLASGTVSAESAARPEALVGAIELEGYTARPI